MKKTLVLSILLTITFFSICAQRNKETLYLKNGSIINGKLIESGDSIYKIKTSDGSLFIYKSSEVDRFEYSGSQFSGRRKDGAGIALEAGFLIGSQDNEYMAPFSFNFIGNYTVNTRNKFGLGSGVEFLGEPFLPLFAEYKYIFNDRKASPFLFLRGGGLIHLKESEDNSDSTYPQYGTKTDYQGGGSFTMGIGISWAKEDNDIYLSFAYRNAHTSYKQKDYNNRESTYKNNYNRLELKLGFSF